MSFWLQGLDKYSDIFLSEYNFTYHLFGYEKTCLPLHKKVDTHVNIQGDDIHVMRKLREWGRHSAMGGGGGIAVNIVRANIC